MPSSPVSVIAIFYDTESAAGRSLERVQQMERDGAIQIVDAAVMTQQADGRKLKIKETAELTSRKGGLRGAAIGGVLGIIFPPSILALGAIGAAAGAALGHFTDQGFNNNLLKEIGENLPPGGSAIVAVIEETWIGTLALAMDGYRDLARYTIEGDAAERLLDQAG